MASVVFFYRFDEVRNRTAENEAEHVERLGGDRFVILDPVKDSEKNRKPDAARQLFSHSRFATIKIPGKTVKNREIAPFLGARLRPFAFPEKASGKPEEKESEEKK